MSQQQEDMRKMLVKRAKCRMLSNDYNERGAVAADEYRCDTSGVCNGDNTEHYLKVVKEIKESDSFVLDPLKRMMDEVYYNSLTENEKMGYILKLSKIYKELSEIL